MKDEKEGDAKCVVKKQVKEEERIFRRSRFRPVSKEKEDARKSLMDGKIEVVVIRLSLFFLLYLVPN